MNKTTPGNCIVCGTTPGFGKFIPKEYLTKKAITLFIKSKKCWSCYNKESSCNKIIVPKDCCYISFGKDIKKHSTYIEHNVIVQTIRGEQVLFITNEKDELVGIELLSSKTCKKRCQDG